MNTYQKEIKVRPALSKQDRERVANRQRPPAHLSSCEGVNKDITVPKSRAASKPPDRRSVTIEAKPAKKKKLRVAAYCRVSSKYSEATVTLKGGESATAEGLPTGVKYTITEAEAEGFTLTGTTGDTGTISTTKSEAEFENTRETGDLELSKVLVSDRAADADVEFTFTVTLDQEIKAGTYGDMTFASKENEDGSKYSEATVTLKGGESATAEGLPTGVKYTITEAEAEGFTLTGTTGDTGTISTTKSEAEFENTRETGDLKVTKTVVSSIEADKQIDFEFTVTLDQEIKAGTYGDMTFASKESEDGSKYSEATVTLKGGESATAEGLPTGVKYTVAETENLDFTTKVDGELDLTSKEKTIATGDPEETAFENSRNKQKLDLVKINDTGTELDGAKFTLAKEDGTIVYDDIETKTDANGKGHFGPFELESGIYFLTETKAPDGYSMLTAAIKIVVSSLNVEVTVEGSPSGPATVSGPVDGVYTIKVRNTPGYELPHTGGIGTTAFTAGGISLIALALFLLMKKRMALHD